MTTKEQTCEVCGSKVPELKKCKGCGRRYCHSCQSPSTDQNFCRECVSMEGVVSKG